MRKWDHLVFGSKLGILWLCSLTSVKIYPVSSLIRVIINMEYKKLTESKQKENKHPLRYYYSIMLRFILTSINHFYFY